MKVTLYSADSVEDALRVVGAMYGVTVVVADAAGIEVTASEQQSAPPRQQSRRADDSESRRSKRRGTKGKQAASTADLRTWARANGHQVSDRGRIPASVLAAYQAAG